METSRASILSSELPWPAAPTVLCGIHQNTLTNQSDQPCQQSLYLKTLTMPLYQLSQCGSYQAPFQFAAGGAGLTLDTSNMSVVLNPQPSTVIQKAPAQTLTLNIVNTLPIMSPNCSPSLTSVSPGKSKNFGKHICAHCGRDCLKPSVLEKHIRSHTGERPFPCTTCGIAFKTQSNLYKHRKTQTHVNNCKLSVDLDCSNCQEDKTDGRLGDNMSLCSTDNADVIVYTDEGETSGTDFSTQENNILSLGNEEVLPVCVKSLQSVQACSGKMHGDSDNPHTGIVSSSVLKQRRMLKDQRSPMASRQVQLQRQHATYVDKQWDSNPLERKLKKCESTDSGYLSHSDSVDFQFFTGSPLNSLSENSIESEHMTSTGALRPDESNAIKMECVDKTTPSMEKRRLEEHISMLISQNKAVVDDRHLDNVRPRKTALSKQGSIDLPMPYTFKDSFHFDIRSLDANRKKVSLCSAKSIVTPHEKNKPLFFHSVPTQFSTTVDSIMVSRSNSLPFIESGRLPPDKVDVHSSKHHCLAKLPLDSSFANLLLNNNVASCTVDFSSSHPRSLVRQTAVDEVPLSTAADCYIQEEKNGKKNLTGEQQTSKGKTGSRKGSKKKINMFSHEKWQMYGDETFKKLYQKIQQNESMKKLKQEAAMPKSLVNNENPLLAANDTVNSSLASTPSGVNTNGSSGSSQANLSSQVASRSRDQELSQSMEAQLSTVHLQKSSGLVKAKCKSSSGIPESEISRLERKHQPLKKQPTNIDMSYLSPDIPQPALKYNYAPPAGCPDNLSVKVTDNHSKLPSISNIDHIGQVCSNNLLLTSEKSPSERKKFKGGELKDTQTLNSKDNINVESEYTCDNSLEPTPKTNVDGTSSLDSIVSGIEDRQLLHKENLTAPVTPCNNPEDASAHVLVQPQPAAASAKLDGNNLSQIHLVKLHRSEPYPEASAPLQSEKDDVSQVMLEEKVVESLNSMHSVPEKEDIDIIPGIQQADWQHYQGEITQVMQTHKSSVNSLLRNNMNAGPVPTCASVLSILEGQDKSQGTQGDNDHNVILDETDMTSHSKISKQVIVKPTSIDPGFNGRFLISAVPGDCPQQILQLQIESNSLVQIPTSTGVKTRDKSEGMKMPLSLATEIDTLELDDSTQVLHNSAENTKTCMSMVTQHVKPVSTQKPDCFAETFSSGNYNMKSTNASIPRLRTGQEHKASSTSCRLSRSTALSGEHEKRLFSVYSTIHHDAIKRGSPESKHWAQYLKVKGPGKIKACSVASRGDFKSVALTALSPSPKEQKTLCAESCSLDDSVKEKGSSKSEASARRSTWSGTRAEHKRRYRVGCKRKGSTSGACKQAGRERFHYKKGHRTSNAIQNPDNCHRKSNVPLSEPARVPNVLQEQDSTSRVACTRSTNGEDSNGKGNQSVEQGTLRTDDPFSLSAQLVLSADVGQLGENLSTFTPEIAAVSVKSQQESSLNRQNSRACSKYQEYGVQGDRRDNASDSVASERQQDHVPQQRQTRKILHRSKTIGHSVGDHTTYESSSLQAGHSIALHGSCVSSMPDLISSLPAVCRDDCIKSREEQSKATHGQSQEPGALPGTEQLLPHNHIESLIHQPTLFKSHKKLSLEALRNQSHVEFSDTSSDDEDRLVIEI